MTDATYVYCVVASRSKPRIARTLKGLPHAGAVRALPIEAGRWLIVSTVPLARYGESALRAGLQDLDWVSVAAVAHERVVESFLSADAVLPMKLFTMSASDDRAVQHVLDSRPQFQRLIARVAKREEWGIRVAMQRAGAAPPHARKARSRGGAATGVDYLRHKKAQRDEVANRARRARAVATELFDALARHASEARKRPATELPADTGLLVLDAALLVPRSRTARLKAAAARHARALSSEGYDVALTGPWPPYSFMQD